MENEQDNVLNLKGQIKAAEARIRVAELESKKYYRGRQSLQFRPRHKDCFHHARALKSKKRELEVDLSERQIHAQPMVSLIKFSKTLANMSRMPMSL